MSLPHFEFPDSPHIAGDPHDDDARVIDSLVESDATPPTPDEEPLTPVEPLIKPKPVSRLITGSVTLNNAAPPIQIVPVSIHRESIRLTLMSTTSTDYIRFSDDSGKLYSLQSCAVLPVYGGGIDLSEHTGPIWVYAPDVAGNVTVSFVAVAEGVQS